MRQAAALGLACALASGSAHANPFTVEHLLSLQDVGRTAFSPNGRWLVMDVEASWSSAQRFDLDAKTFLALGRPMVVDLDATGAARPLLPVQSGVTYTTGAFSPDGSKVVVFRLRGRSLDLGIVDIASGNAVWPNLPVDAELGAPVARWLDDQALVVLSRTAETSRSLAGGWVQATRSAQAWDNQAAGRGSGVVLGSGRYRVLNPPPPKARLVKVKALTGEIHEIAQGAFVDMILSPDHNRVALIAEAEGLPANLERPSLFKSGDRRRLILADLRTRKVQIPCPTCDLARLSASWSSDSRAVLVAARRDGGSAQFGYWRLDIDGGSQRLAPDLTAGETTGRDPQVVGGAAWLDGAPVVLAKEKSAERLDWWRLSAKGPTKLTGALAAAPGPPLASDPRGLVLATPGGPVRLSPSGRLEALASASARLSFPARLAGETARGVVATADGVSRAIWPTVGKGWPNPTPTQDRVLDVLPDRGLTASLARDAHGVKTVVVRDRRGAARTVLTLNAMLADTYAAAPIAVHHHDPSGQARTSWLYMPAETSDGDIPVVVLPYPGSAYPTPPFESEPGELAFTSNTQVLASAGFAVLVPSLPLAADADPGKGLAASMLAALEAARAQEPKLSATRAALWGQSYGGWGVLMAASQTDRFKAVIATSPITDLFTFHGVISPQALASPDRYFALPSMYGWSETGQGRMLAPPWKDPERYRRNSPALLTDHISAPVMLVTSDNDFTSGQSTPVFSALFRQDKDAVLVSYRGEAHVVLAPDNVRDLYARALSFLSDAMGPPTTARAAPVRDSQ